MSKPSVFIGSSREGIEIARAIGFQLKDDGEVTIWNEGVFPPTIGTLEALVAALDRFDFAILALTPDDMLVVRGHPCLSPRDNVLFELGLFMGRLGRTRTFVICSDDKKMKLPSDLAGVTTLMYDAHCEDAQLVPAVSAACVGIRKAIRDLGFSEGRGLRRLDKATQQVEGVSGKLQQLVTLLARSRAVELDLVSKQFGRLLPAGFLDKIRLDLSTLERATSSEENPGDKGNTPDPENLGTNPDPSAQ